MGFRAMPRTDLGVPYMEDTTGYTATMKVRDASQAGAIQVEASTANGRIQVGFTPRKWAVATVYGIGEKRVPTVLNGFVYEVTVGGTSHATVQPTWPTTIGQTVTDGTVTWRAETSDSQVANVYIHLPIAVTTGLVDWGYGVWSLEVTDTFAHTWLFIDGVARLRKESSV